MNKYVKWSYGAMEILFPLLDNINDYVALIYRKYVDLDRNNRIFRPGEKKLCNAANQTN